ncbi:hypothetical protein EVJ58_g6823 [Rhodofomes roseus]|uniref:Uncharacterized protein n=1 Tax=Rhodofomes roseus TaxID=34475 RepID=A0A4Y9Y7K9_9APHY|nr:hypothetical protein EVJ58_g6823 [Rhodofomes roseus]
MSLQPINRTSIPFLWRHEDEAEIIKEYIFTIQQERQQGVDEDEAELSDTETIYSDATSADESDDPMDVDEAETEGNGEKRENKSVGTHEEGTDGNGVGSCATNEDPKSEFPIGMYNKDEEEVRESQRAWDAVALGSPPFDKRESLVQWHEYLMRALNEMDEELAKKEGTPSLAIKRREPAIGLEEGGIIEKVSDKLRMRSTIEVEHAIENLRRGLVYLAQSLYQKQGLMETGRRSEAYPPTFMPPPPVKGPAEGSTAYEESEYVFV